MLIMLEVIAYNVDPEFGKLYIWWYFYSYFEHARLFMRVNAQKLPKPKCEAEAVSTWKDQLI